MKQLAFALTVTTLTLLAAAPAGAQVQLKRPKGPVTAAEAPGRLEDQNARETRDRLNNILRQYPPSLWEVLRLDPSLLTNEAYLAPYPTLAAFLAQHPEIAHNPGFFIGDRSFREEPASAMKLRAMQEALAGAALFTAFLVLVSVGGWVLKAVIDHRRWLRLSKVQTDVHTKLLDRFTSNEDLLAYIQTPVGRRFLESAPIAIEAPRTMGAPIGRILWSVQTGLVVGFAGAALLVGAARLEARGGDFADFGQLLDVIGMLGVCIGIGFVISAVVSYALSHRLGLFEPPPALPHA